MIVKLRLEITDAARNAIACRLRGKKVKALATREEVADLVNKLIAGYCDPEIGDYETTDQIERVDDRSISEQIDDKGGHEEIMRAMTKQQRATLRKFGSMYHPIGFVGDDLIIERDYANSVIRQRISPAGQSATCRSGSFRPIQPMKS